jgi:hypothetical protein
VEQLPQVAVGLKDARSLASLHPLFKLKDDALKQRGEQQGGKNLGYLKDDVSRDHRLTLRTAGAIATMDDLTA